ncbi:DNA double-strand break repair nuclease NurA [Candidatus Babeliales bacterium]|nr:DNA double-strand break repair nuclease NurA [Candidatus Babeliales bacterium]
MLDRQKLAKDLYSKISQLFPDTSSENDLARKTWNKISCDDSFAHRTESAQSSFLVPTWDGNLTDRFSIKSVSGSYEVIAVDGSQIYPDRHVSGAGCFLLNTGGVQLSYSDRSCATFFSQPDVLLPEDVLEGIKDVSFSRDLVDLKREELELATLAEKAEGVASRSSRVICEANCIEGCEQKTAPVALIDGSIIFWQLEGKPDAVKTFFLDRYLGSLQKLYENNVLFAGYISMSKSRELVSLIKLGLCRFLVADCIGCHRKHETFPCGQVDSLLDTSVTRFFLKKHERTTVFYSTSKIIESYPDHLKPAFVYLDVGSEVVRLEVPTWIAQDREKLDYLCSVAIDQSEKGRGYPVCLAEAHEQAVVKGGDREFFYHLLQKIGLDQQKSIRLSQKAIKKRGIGI